MALGHEMDREVQKTHPRLQVVVDREVVGVVVAARRTEVVDPVGAGAAAPVLLGVHVVALHRRIGGRSGWVGPRTVMQGQCRSSRKRFQGWLSSPYNGRGVRIAVALIVPANGRRHEVVRVDQQLTVAVGRVVGADREGLCPRTSEPHITEQKKGRGWVSERTASIREKRPGSERVCRRGRAVRRTR